MKSLLIRCAVAVCLLGGAVFMAAGAYADGFGKCYKRCCAGSPAGSCGAECGVKCALTN